MIVIRDVLYIMTFRLRAFFLIVVWLFTVRLIKITLKRIKKLQHFRFCIVMPPCHSPLGDETLKLIVLVNFFVIKLHQEISSYDSELAGFRSILCKQAN